MTEFGLGAPGATLMIEAFGSHSGDAGHVIPVIGLGEPVCGGRFLVRFGLFGVRRSQYRCRYELRNRSSRELLGDLPAAVPLRCQDRDRPASSVQGEVSGAGGKDTVGL